MSRQELIRVILFCATVSLVYVLELTLAVVAVVRRLGAKPARSVLLSKPAWVLHGLALVGVVCFLYGRFIEPYWIELNRFTLTTGKLERASFRIVHISDLHCESEPLNEPRMVRIVNALEPDVIVFTGDALNSAAALPLFKQTMRRLTARLAKVAVYGNFEIEFWNNLDLYSSTGFELLDGRTVCLEKDGERLYISGTSYRSDRSAAALLREVPADSYSILAYHYPDLAEDLQGLNVDLYLAGHTHGGQVAIPFYGALVTLSKFGKKYEAGMYKLGRTVLYVNRGLGLEMAPAPKVRFFARPEIAVFDLQPKP